MQKNHFQTLLIKSFKKDLIPESGVVTVPGSGIFFEASSVFELFKPIKIMTIDPDKRSFQTSLMIFQHYAHRASVKLAQMEHYTASLGSICEKEFCDQPHFYYDNDSAAVALFIHPGPLIDGEKSLYRVWKEVFTDTLNILHPNGRAIFILREHDEFTAVINFLSKRYDFVIRSAFCQNGLLMKPFAYPDARIYRCIINAQK